MVTLTEKNSSKKTPNNVNDEFEKYLLRQRMKTTFNGSELAAFSWYKKILGIA